MRKHTATFSDTIKARCAFAGITLDGLQKKTGIPRMTMFRRLEDGNWTREQMQQMNRFLHFEEADMKTFLEGR